MLENSSTDSSATVKRYAPLNQRNRSLGRRKSGDRLERANSFVTDGEKNQNNASRSTNNASRSTPIMDHGFTGSTTHMIETSRTPWILLHGCCGSEAFQLLNNRWAAAMNAYSHLPEDSAERPVLYARSASPWGHAMLPHLLMQQTTGDKDFLTELRQAMRNANAGSDV